MVVDMGAVEHIAGNKDDVGTELAEDGDQSMKEAAADDVAEVRVGDESGGTSTPDCRETGKFDGDALHANVGGIEDAIEAGQ